MKSHIVVHQIDPEDKTMFGFWVYLMTDCVLFAALFATYAVLHANTFGGPSGHTLFDLNSVLAETLILLTSSFTTGLAMIAVHRGKLDQVIGWFATTFILGISFLSLELLEFHHLIANGNSWTRSGFLSAFFSLVGTHGIHISIGLLWMSVLMYKVWHGGLTPGTMKRLTLLSLFWHFLDVIWIFIFTIVYLMGAIS
jgi:cytochrome o ubiquinol oxidase subunit 3